MGACDISDTSPPTFHSPLTLLSSQVTVITTVVVVVLSAQPSLLTTPYFLNFSSATSFFLLVSFASEWVLHGSQSLWGSTFSGMVLFIGHSPSGLHVVFHGVRPTALTLLSLFLGIYFSFLNTLSQKCRRLLLFKGGVLTGLSHRQHRALYDLLPHQEGEVTLAALLLPYQPKPCQLCPIIFFTAVQL